jgi:hypothetical protein
VWVFKKEAPEKPKATFVLNSLEIDDSESGVSLLQQDHHDQHKKQDAQQTSSSSEALSANGVDGVSGGGDDIGVREAYSQLLRVLKLPAMSKLCMILLSCKVAFAVTDAATTLKFVEYGVPKEQLAYFAPAFVG